MLNKEQKREFVINWYNKRKQGVSNLTNNEELTKEIQEKLDNIDKTTEEFFSNTPKDDIPK
jgi:hypothetical protein